MSEPRFTANPVLMREVKERVRSARATVILIVYLAVLSSILYLIYTFAANQIQRQSFSPFSQFAAPSLGRVLFETLLLVLLILVAFIAPGLAAGSISSERERRTLQLLQITLLSPRSIAMGKIGSSLAFQLLLLIATAPLFVVPLTLGGVRVGDVLRGGLVIVVVAVFISSISTYMSTVIKRTQFATVAAYGLVMMYFLGTLITWAVEESNQMGQGGPVMSIYLNPITAAASAVATPGVRSGFSPLSGIASGFNNRRIMTTTSSTGVTTRVGFSASTPTSYVWLIHVFFASSLSAIFIGLTAHRLRTPALRFVLSEPKS